MRSITGTKRPCAMAGLGAVLILLQGCAMMEAGTTTTPTTPWSQQLATQAAGAFEQQMKALYQSALDEPVFAGERSEYGEMKDQLRVLKEESASLHERLSKGETRDQTLHTWERIKEVQRDLLDSENWQFIPSDFSEAAQMALQATQALDQMYGTTP